MTRIRLALVIPTLDQSGAEKQLTLLATGLPPSEFDVRVFALTRGGPYEDVLRGAEVPVEVIGKSLRIDPLCWARLRRRLREWQPAIVQSYLFAANSYVRLALGPARPRARSARPRVIVSERCVDTWKAGWQKWLDRKLIPRTDWLVGNSGAVVEFYRQLGYPAERTSIIPNGIDRPEVDPAARARLRAQLKLRDDAFLAGTVGRLADQKRIQDFVWAIETLRQVRPQLHGVVVGDGPARPMLERMMRDIGCADHLSFVGHQPQATEWISALDAFVLPSSFEGMSNSLMEAMALGCPVIASDIAANHDLVLHEQTGLLTPVGDSVAIMHRLRQLIDEPELATRLGTAASEHIAANFSVSQMVDRYRQLYRTWGDVADGTDAQPRMDHIVTEPSAPQSEGAPCAG